MEGVLMYSEEHEFLIVYNDEYLGMRSEIYSAEDAKSALTKFHFDNIGLDVVVISIQQIN